MRPNFNVASYGRSYSEVLSRKLAGPKLGFFLLLMLLITAACLSWPRDISAGAQRELRFVITAAVASDPSYTYYRELSKYVADKVGAKAVFISDLSYGQVDQLFIDKKVDVGFLCNSHFARRKAITKFEPVGAPVIAGHGKPKFRVYAIVNKKSSLNSLDDLKGKTVDLADPLSTTGVYAAYLLGERNQSMKSFFGKTIYSGTHDMTIQLVASGLVDAGFIDGHIWDYHEKVDPVYSSQTKVIFRSPEFTIPPVVAAGGLDQSLKKKINEVLHDMHEDPKGKEILKKLRINRFVDIRDSDYNDVLHMYNRVKDRL